jgi:chaperone required for assembly of F1-ATPase
MAAMPRRFYREVVVARAPEGHVVRLDERALRSPAGNPFGLPTVRLAEAIAEEWRAQGDEIRPATMPLMQLAATAIDRVAPAPHETIEAIAAYAETDLLCYWAAEPTTLVERQQRLWQPILDWASLALDAPFAVATGVVPRPQPAGALSAVRATLAGRDPFGLAALGSLTAASGSVILALAVLAGRLDAETAFALSQLDESFQIERWGEDAAAAARRAELRAEVQVAARFLALLEA